MVARWFWVPTLLLVGCVSQPDALTRPEQFRAAVPFVAIGQTTREDLLATLGTPTWSFEAGRILSWRLEHDGKRMRPMVRGAAQPNLEGVGVRWYGLVVVFDAGGKAVRFSLVEQV
ncbi:MAG: hypothetical protein RL398_772 [Planctomycetota bacterium]|jgi:hypothetical protein